MAEVRAAFGACLERIPQELREPIE